MVPYGLALAPFGRKVAGQSSSQISRALYMINYKLNYITMKLKVNTFSLFGCMISQLLNHIQIVGINSRYPKAG